MEYLVRKNKLYKYNNILEMEKAVIDNRKKLILIKLLHTLIWGVFVVAILYINYAGLFDRVNFLVWICIGAIIIETLVLFICKWRCPLTLLAGKYTDKKHIGFDIYIPNWLARHNKTIFASLFMLGVVLVIWRVI